MATAPVLLVNGTGVAGVTWTTASFTPAANTRLIAYVMSTKATAGVVLPTISDTGGLTWVQLADRVTSTFANPDIRGTWFISNAVGSSPAARTVTVASTGAQSVAVVIASVLASEISGSIVQSTSGEDLTTGDPSMTFAAAPGATNITLMGGSHGGANAVTIVGGYTAQGNGQYSTARRITTAYDITSAASTCGYTSLNTRALVLGIELAPPPTGRVGKVWNGSAWVAKPVKVWNGSAWNVKPVKIWSGSAWI